MSDHSELPWTSSPAERYGDGFFIGNDHENTAFVPGYQDHPQIIANAALIVHSVNALPVVVAALEQALKDLRDYEKDSTGESYNNLQINAALELSTAKVVS